MASLFAAAALWAAPAGAQTTVPGVTDGVLAVDAGGAAGYSIPIAVPPGIAGMAPDLSLNYSSNAGNGVLGMGWSLGGLSAVFRCPRTPAQDGAVGGVNFDADDRFCLDGQRLVAVSGAYGADGTEYRTEIESFTKVVSYGTAGSGPERFKAWTKSGQVIEYGFTDDSQVNLPSRPEIRLWAVNTILDSAGNYLTLSYAEDTVTGSHRIERIDYAGNAAMGVAPFASARFSYEARPDPITGYQAGALTTQDQRLTAVRSYHGENLVRDYQIAYETSAATGRSRVTSITECSGDGTCLTPILFGWQDNGAKLGTSNTLSGVVDWGYATGREWTDVNGDGRADYCRRVGSKNLSTSYVSCTLSTATGFGETFTSDLLDWGKDAGREWADVNGDGLADYCRVVGSNNLSSSYVSCTLSTGSNLGDTIISGVIDWGHDTDRRWVDVNGDGRADYCRRVGTNNLSSSYVSCTLSTGTGFGDTIMSGVIDWGHDTGRAWVDANGDGRADYCRVVGSNNLLSSHVSCTLSTGTGFGDTITSGVIDWGHDADRRWVDANSDGLADYCRRVGTNNLSSSHVSCTLSTGTGFGDTITSGVIDWGHDTGREWVDANGDGLADYCRVVGSNNLSSSYVSCTLFDGTGFGDTITSGVLDWGHASDRVWTDANGDGLADYCRRVGSKNRKSSYLSCLIDEERSPDVLDIITDSLGTDTTVTYKPLTDASVYQKGTGAIFPELDVQAPLYVVAEVSTDDGVGGLARTSYEYVGARIHLQGRGFLGFESMLATDEQTGITTETKYLQKFPFIGSIASSESYLDDGDRTTFRTLVNTWAPDPYDGSVPVFPYVSQAVAKSYEINDGPSNQVPVTTATTTSAFDGFGNATGIVATTEGAGETFVTTTTSTYDNDTVNWFLGRLRRAEVEQRLPDGSTSTRVSAFAYDPATGLLSQEVIEPDRPALRLTTDYARDGHGNILTTTVSGADIATRSTKTFYTGDGRFPERTENALGHSETRVFDPNLGTVIGHTGPNGISTSWEYDGFGRKTREVRADGTATKWAYEFCTSAACVYKVRRREVIDLTDATIGAPVTDHFDELNRLTSQRTRGFDGTPVYTDTQFNARGEVIKVSRPYFDGTPGAEKQWTTTAYDVLGRPVSVTAPDGGVTSTVYDGLTTTTTNALDQVETRTDNAFGQLVEVTDDAGTTVAYTYDPHGNLTRTDAGGVVTTMDYDIRGRKVFMDDPDMGVWTYDHNVLGELVSQTDAKDQTVTMDYDKLGRMTLRTEAEGETTWTYDNPAKTAAIGKLTEVSRSQDDYAEDYSFDGLGRAQATTVTYEGLDYTTTNSYDEAGRLDVLTYPHPVDDWLFEVEHEYTNLGYLKEVREAGGATVYWQAIEVDAEGRVVEEQLGNGLTTFRDYDPADGLVRAIQTFQGSTPLQDLAFDFDLLGNLVARSDLRPEQGRSETFDYDGLNRLTGATLTDTVTQTQLGQTTYAYDALGNLTFKSDVGGYAYGVGAGPHAVTAAGNKTFAYDANGSMTSSTESGNPTRSVAWSSFNKPVRVTSHTTLNSRDIVYGPDRARIKQTVVKGAAIKTITYAGGLLEKHSKAGTPDELVHYIRAGGTVAIFTRVVDSNPSTDKTRYLHKDHLGSIDLITNEDGENGYVAERLSYDPHGQRRAEDWQAGPVPTPSETHRGFTGHEHLDSVGLIHMNGRVYDPVIGRFLSADPFVPAPTSTQSFNRYSYVNNNPLSFTDPSGFVWKKIKKLGKKIKKAFKKIGRFFMKSRLGQIVGMALINLASLACGPAAPACAAGGNAAFSSARSLTNGNDLGNSLLAAAVSVGSGGAIATLGGNEGGNDSGSSFLAFLARFVAHGAVKGVRSALRDDKSRSGTSVSGRNGRFRSGSPGGIAVRFTADSFSGVQLAQASNEPLWGKPSEQQNYPWSKEAERALTTNVSEVELLANEARWWARAKKLGLEGQATAARWYRQLGYEVYDGFIAVETSRGIRRPDLAYREPGGQWEFLEVKANTSPPIRSQVLKDREIETRGFVGITGPAGILGRRGPRNVSLIRVAIP